jgi:hypothetical protein
MRRTAGVTLAAFLLSLLAMAPLGLHAHSATAGSNYHSDFCTSEAPGGDVALPLAPHPDNTPNANSHCNDCAGCAGGTVAQPALVAPWLAVAVATRVIVVATPPPTPSVDDVVSRPRGPPLRA